jgi:hypothetical protein
MSWRRGCTSHDKHIKHNQEKQPMKSKLDTAGVSFICTRLPEQRIAFDTGQPKVDRETAVAGAADDAQSHSPASQHFSYHQDRLQCYAVYPDRVPAHPISTPSVVSAAPSPTVG